MAEDGHHINIPKQELKKSDTIRVATERNTSASTEDEKVFSDPPMSPRDYQKNPFSSVQTSLDVDDYFVSVSLAALL